MKNKVYILTGPIQSGKTTALQKWCETRIDVSGIVSPVINGSRYFFDIASSTTFYMEANDNEKEILAIGRFYFSKKAFKKAINTLTQANNKYIIVDEVGPLELKKQGFYEVLNKIILSGKFTCILVVRDGLVEEVIQHFGISNAEIISKDDLQNL